MKDSFLYATSPDRREEWFVDVVFREDGRCVYQFDEQCFACPTCPLGHFNGMCPKTNGMTPAFKHFVDTWRVLVKAKAFRVEHILKPVKGRFTCGGRITPCWEEVPYTLPTVEECGLFCEKRGVRSNSTQLDVSFDSAFESSFDLQ